MTTNERNHWLQQRRKGIGGSDAAGVMGLNQYTEWVNLPDGTQRLIHPYGYVPSAYQIWLDKTGQEPRDVPDNLQMAAGRSMEPLILKQYEELTGETLLPHPAIITHPQFPFVLASLDGWTETAVVEAKFGKWTPKWGPDGSDIVPLNYWIQVQHYMLVTGLKIAHICALLYGETGLQYHIYDIEADEEWHEQALRRYQEFWAEVEAVTPPEPFDLADLKSRFPQSVPLSRREITPELMEKLEELRRIKGQITNLEADQDSLKLDLIRYFEDYEALTFQGEIVATYKTNKSGRRTLIIR